MFWGTSAKRHVTAKRPFDSNNADTGKLVEDLSDKGEDQEDDAELEQQIEKANINFL